MTAQNQSANIYATPEEYYTPPKGEHGINDDVLLTLLSRAQAVTVLLIENGQDLQTGFTLNHALVTEAISAIDGYIEQALQMVRQANQGGAK